MPPRIGQQGRDGGRRLSIPSLTYGLILLRGGQRPSGRSSRTLCQPNRSAPNTRAQFGHTSSGIRVKSIVLRRPEKSFFAGVSCVHSDPLRTPPKCLVQACEGLTIPEFRVPYTIGRLLRASERAARGAAQTQPPHCRPSARPEHPSRAPPMRGTPLQSFISPYPIPHDESTDRNHSRPELACSRWESDGPQTAGWARLVENVGVTTTLFAARVRRWALEGRQG